MKHTLFILGSLLISQLVNAQFSKADVSITSMTIAPHTPNAPKTIVAPASNNQPIGENQNRKISLPGTEKPEPFYLKCTITIHNGNEDPSQETNMIVVIPGQGTAYSMSSDGINIKLDPTSPYVAYIQYNLGQLSPGQTKILQVVYQRSTTYPNKVSAFIFSKSSDPNPVNNYKEVSY